MRLRDLPQNSMFRLISRPKGIDLKKAPFFKDLEKFQQRIPAIILTKQIPAPLVIRYYST